MIRLSQNPQQSIFSKIENVWSESGAWPEFIEAMRLAFPDKVAKAYPERDPAQWAHLPDLCCQAAGGNEGWADEIASAWFLLYMSAQLFDNLQDQDQPEPWWQELGAGPAINVASGLVLSGLSILNNIHKRPELSSVAGEICDRFYHQGFIMSSGQHRDLITERPGVDEWFEIAGAKSGSFFGLGCWAGARLATGNSERLNGFSQFGSYLGILVQIHDDLDDLRNLRDQDDKESIKGITRSLPLAYALEVCSEEMRKRLLKSLRNAYQKKEAAQSVFDLLNQSGAPLFLKIQMERLLKLAQASLDVAKPEPSVRDTLHSFLLPFLENDKLG